MDSIDRSDSNLPARFPTASHSLPALGPVFAGDLATTPSPQINSRTILRGLTRHWWQILLFWLVVSAPIVFAIYRSSSRLTKLSAHCASSRRNPVSSKRPERQCRVEVRHHFLQTQANLLTTDKVLTAAINQQSVVSLPLIMQSMDPKIDLRKMLLVEIVDEAYLIQVALELPDGKQAATIVNAVVDAYLLYNNEFNRRANSTLTNNLEAQLKKFRARSTKKRDELKEFYATKGTVDAPKLRSIPKLESTKTTQRNRHSAPLRSQVQGMADEMVKTDLELAEAEAALKILEEKAANQANEQENAQALNQIDEELEPLIVEEFRKDPEVIALKDAIIEMRNELDHNKAVRGWATTRRAV